LQNFVVVEAVHIQSSGQVVMDNWSKFELRDSLTIIQGMLENAGIVQFEVLRYNLYVLGVVQRDVTLVSSCRYDSSPLTLNGLDSLEETENVIL
jgi:hypothetical protein